MKFATKFAGNWKIWKSYEEHDEDHEDLHPTFPDFFQKFQKGKMSTAFESLGIIHQESMNFSCKNNIKRMDRRK